MVLPRAVLGFLRAMLRGEAGAASRAVAIIAGFALTAFSYVMARCASAWVLATERQGEERSAQMDEAFSLGTSAEIALLALPTKGVAE
jgi:hypothetical protein